VLNTDTGRDYALGIQSFKRLAEPADIGGVIAFLASDDARWITGEILHVDDGSKLRAGHARAILQLQRKCGGDNLAKRQPFHDELGAAAGTEGLGGDS
jgi:hypothetical protein